MIYQTTLSWTEEVTAQVHFEAPDEADPVEVLKNNIAQMPVQDVKFTDPEPVSISPNTTLN